MKLFQLDFDWLKSKVQPQRAPDIVELNSQPVPVLYRRNDRAKRYRLFLNRQGQPHVTIPRRGSRSEAQQFVESHKHWLAEKMRQFAVRQERNRCWPVGAEILFRGEVTRIEASLVDARWIVRLGVEGILVPSPDGDLRPLLEQHLRQLATVELPPCALELAARHGCNVRKVAVRNQISRWGSCSRRGTISLNWRLVQVPVEVRDYIILHELMHLREMNHSRRFWAHVEQVCPPFRSAEAWLRQHGPALL